MFADSGKPEKKGSGKNGETMDTAEEEKSASETSSRRSSTSAPDTSDPVRLKCRELLSAALKVDGNSCFYPFH